MALEVIQVSVGNRPLLVVKSGQMVTQEKALKMKNP